MDSTWKGSGVDEEQEGLGKDWIQRWTGSGVKGI